MNLEHKHNQKHGFKTPDDYFKSFDDKLFETLSNDTLDKEMSSGFKTPEGYFDTIDESILNKVNSEKKVIAFRPHPRFYYIAGIAASLVLLFAIVLNTNNNSEISAEMVETYFQESDLNSYELAELLSEANILEDDFVISETQYDEENLESYLLEQTDIEQLLQ